jgi:SAM-dependent methyltransferase
MIESVKTQLKAIPLVAKTWSFLYARRPAWWIDSVNRRRLRQTPIQRVFENIFLHNRFQDPTNAMEDQDSISGPGSSLGNTEAIRKQLPDLLKNFEVSSLLDVPCGDFNWMRLVDLNGVEYIGGDIVPELISRNAERYEKNQVRFMQIDLTHDDLPNVDLILVRDCFIHLANRDIVKALRNIQRSGIKFLLTTTYPEHRKNIDIVTGQFRPVNLDRPPFNFPKPIKLIREGLSNSEYTDKSLGLWKVPEIVV